MNIPVWDASMSVGIAEMDDDHRVLLGLISEFSEASYDPDAYAALSSYLDALDLYTASHLAREERMLEAVAYPDLARHRLSHDEFRGQCEAFKRQLEDDAEALEPAEVERYLVDWWTRHILGEDMAYKPFVEDSEVARRAVGRPA